MIPTLIIAAVLIVYAVYAIQKTRKRIKNGCCGGGGDERVILKVDPSKYQYHESFQVEGMHCDSCAARIESVFQSQDMLFGVIDLKKNRLHIYSKEPIDQSAIRTRVESLGYRIPS